MRRLLALALAGCLAAVGCNKGETAGTKSGGGTGSVAETTTSKKKSKETRPATPPGVEVVPTPVTLKQGETKSSRLNITREGGYDKEIKVEFDVADTGLNIPAVTIPASTDSKQTMDINITAAKDAKGGSVDFNVTGAGLEPKPGMFIVSVARNKKK